jgi:rhodanese-related sulfurtransferase
MRLGRIVLLDVLSPESFAALHIPGAINLPVADLARGAPEVLPDRHADIVAYCGGPT